ncbi:leucyl/phenylalanyl-tRNA--protein transferase [Rhodoferax mekongensis]|uniref:Leucyl/phenylalanyl-tRNA--protein transferase n=1 Tax=Rhodoferax mekongensis TaxID=3068341 RepID=A0ABZ0AV48_9BURK|nr:MULTISPECIES: leucyl/phenylalanyl-tRNA--protein transferase [unclassified Rhodoferax]MDT7515891.1 leucyl/phenylalanyl-tRNA--protein transferase [Rhodoferax sp. TBRC 17199]WNO03327.1 leucyl/phenylalanyl-tRNA--protein transferase [Rhodoferax sp. TBRC 17307]
MQVPSPTVPWLQPADPFPSIFDAWGEDTPAPGLLAAGGALDADTLLDAYRHGIFPWFSDGQPTLWWSTNPRMTLHTSEFRLHRSLRKVIKKFRNTPGAEIRIDHDFGAIIDACAGVKRAGQSGTWIVPEMKAAYMELHRRGHAHSVETWQDGVLIGGLYCVSVGRAIFGESMFARRTDASKIALTALVGMSLAQGVDWIDCQQVTDHLAFMGARPVDRSIFSDYLSDATAHPGIEWKFQPLYWDQLLSACANPT